MRAWLWLILLVSTSSAQATSVELARFDGGETGIESLREAPESSWKAAPALQRGAAEQSWWRLRVKQPQAGSDIVLSLKETYDASVTVWMPPDYRPQHAGIFDPAWKQVGSRHRLAFILPADFADQPVYVRHEGGRYQPMAVAAMPLETYVALDLQRVRFTSAILASLLLLGIVATVYAIALWRWMLLMFCGWVASCVLYVAAMSGEIVALLPWPSLLPHAMRMSGVAINFGLVMVYGFTIGFLELDRCYPRAARLMKVLVAIAAVLAIVIVIWPRSPLANQAINIVALALAVLALGTAAARARSGSPQGWFYLIGWGGVTVAGVARVWFFLNHQGTPPMLEWLHPLAYAVGALVLVLATARAARYAERELHVARHEARTDPLTELPNRAEFDAALAARLHAARESGAPLWLMFLDLDHFKSINDRHGHAVGDACLKAVGDILRKHVRAGDLIARYGGEEFVLMIEGAGAQRALDAAESLRAAVNAEAIRVKPHRIVLSVSIGLSELRAEDEAAELLARADAALYRAKQNGRNRVEADFADKPGVSAP